MIKSRLIEVLRTFSKKDFREFKKWIDSPFHNQRQDVVALYNYLLENNNLHNESSLDKQIVFPYVYKDEKYDDSKMRQVMHFMFKSIEDYLSYIEINKNPTYLKIALARNYRKKKLVKQAEKTINSIENELKRAEIQSNAYFRNKYLFEEEKYNFLIGLKQVRTELNLQDASESLEISFIVDKLNQAGLMASHKSVYNVEYDVGLLNEVLKYIENKDLLTKPYVATYYYIYKTLVEKEVDSHFENLKLRINSFGHIFPPEEKGPIYLMAINYCIRRMNASAKEYVKEAFWLYKEGIENKALIEDTGNLSRFAFQNVIAIALRLKEYKWVEDFINNYQSFLQEKYRKSSVHYNQAKLYYEKGDYEKATELFMQFEHKDILLNLNAKSMLLKMYYEQSEFRILESLLESVRAYLQRKKVMGYHKSNYKNIIRYTKKLLKVNPYSKAQKEKLKAEIETAKPLTEKAWLLKQLAEL